ncbi:hypothetical protein [Streptomyces sp. NBC_00344]|uniref:hypothetical protein n=1 Tax=Streptomyces sp. NBC_00344 TaxID=2975720 RepID=UPI002E223B53
MSLRLQPIARRAATARGAVLHFLDPHEMGAHVLSKRDTCRLYRIEAELEVEAEKVTHQFLGKVILQNRHAENEAAREEGQSANATV